MGDWDIYCAICGNTFSLFWIGLKDYDKEVEGPLDRCASRCAWLEQVQVAGNIGNEQQGNATFPPYMLNGSSLFKCHEAFKNIKIVASDTDVPTGFGASFLSGHAWPGEPGNHMVCEEGIDSCIKLHPTWSSDTDSPGIDANCYDLGCMGDEYGLEAFPFHYSCYHILFKAIEHERSLESNLRPAPYALPAYLNSDYLYAALRELWNTHPPEESRNDISLGLKYGTNFERIQGQAPDYKTPDVPLLLNPVRIPEIAVFAEQFKTSGVRKSEPSRNKTSALIDLPMELRLSILDRLHFKDLQSLALSGALGVLAPMSWWRQRFLADFPWLWELRGRAFCTTEINWALAYAHINRQSQDDRIEDDDYAVNGLELLEAYWEAEKDLLEIPRLREDELRDYLAGLRAPAAAPVHGSASIPDQQDAAGDDHSRRTQGRPFCKIPGLVSRRRIWEICSTQIVPTYLGREQVKGSLAGTALEHRGEVPG